MPDRIDKSALQSINPYENYRVERSPDSTEDEDNRREQKQHEDQEHQQEQFSAEADVLKKMTGVKSAPQAVELTVDNVVEAWFDRVDVMHDPSTLYLKVRVEGSDQLVLISTLISRASALQLQSLEPGAVFVMSQWFADAKIWVKVVRREALDDEEVTKVGTAEPIEGTLSQTLKMLGQGGKGWMELLGIRDPATGDIDREVVVAYLTVLAIGGVLFLLASFFFL